MKLQAAVILEQGVTFAVVAVNQSVTRYTSRAIRARYELSALFPSMRIILMSLDNSGVPHFYGRKDIVDFLKSIRLSQIPWREYYLY